MKVQAKLKNLRISPRKVRLVTHSLIGIDTDVALVQLEKQIKKSSEPVAKLLKSAIANATNSFGLDASNLYIREISVGDGMRLERWLPRAFGRATPLVRRSSHVVVTLEERVSGKNRVNREKGSLVPKEGALAREETEEASAKKTSTSTGSVQSSPVPKGGDKNRPKPKMGKVVKKIFQRKAT